jgi:signal transduction histidine kinase
MPNATTQPTSGGTADLQIPMPDVVRFVRQLSHDLRNHLNAAELQSAFLNEIAEDGEVKQEVQRLRAMLSEMGASLQRLTTSLAEVRLTEMPYPATAFIEDLQQKLAARSSEESSAVDWNVRADGATLNIDPQVLQQAFLELLANAFLHERGDGPILANAETRDGKFRFTLREPKPTFSGSIEAWGQQPFRKVKHGHYGLGLPRVRSIIQAHGGELTAQYDQPSSSLITTVVLPLGSGE